MKALKYIILAVAIPCAMTWLQYHPGLFLLAFVVFVGYLFTLPLSTFGIGMSRRKLLPHVAIAVSIVLWECLLQFNQIYSWTDLLAIKIETGKYDACKNSGIVFEGNRLSVCDVNEKSWRTGFTEAVIYDSSGQITLNHRQLSPDWVHAALQLKGVPFGVAGFDATKLTGNFYLVTFYIERDDDLIKR